MRTNIYIIMFLVIVSTVSAISIEAIGRITIYNCPYPTKGLVIACNEDIMTWKEVTANTMYLNNEICQNGNTVKLITWGTGYNVPPLKSCTITNNRCYLK